MTLEEFFHQQPRVALAFSGGVDSAYLLYEAARLAQSVQAYYVNSPFQPQFELEDAQRLAQQLQVPLTVLPLDVLSDPQVAANPPDRCYFCKRKIFTALCSAAAADGFSTVLDGTNASDQAGDRPGMRALAELSVRSPLRECGLTKEEIRSRSRQAGLFTWDKPAYACLATRIPTGQAITLQDLQRTEQAEGILFSMGFTDFRIRLLGNCARLQLPSHQLSLLLDKREQLLSRLKPYYSAVLLDLEVRR
ncbi:ATP-dependent sacrificial sulfur transferase LarE [Flavonifractor sp. An100]|uniref:ATP-dependent sacrificial sulfur transferase LarE n=1 Tax=Flavonifractor sp. An100 TaxID=1965538 RepID=UPI000B3694FC|nr:ATP-dependent sacrificial sulfur transferase LarE [Flavonifractor sp. An100]OUQ82206.1 TIGR00268 family protein [Flavonifractor sp. An100]